jgi:hypothetical protein
LDRSAFAETLPRLSAFQHFSISAFQHFSISAFQHFSISAFPLMVTAVLEPRVIPTYPVGAPEKNPLFFEKRVYQGSCGKV